jgi:DNA mismatch repair protein MutS2
LEEARREKREAVVLDKLREKERSIETSLRGHSGGEQLSLAAIKEGSHVHVLSLGCDATVLKLDSRQGRVRVRAGMLEVELPVEDLVAAGGKTKKHESRSRSKITEEPEVAREINLIGMRVDNASSELEQFLNHASLAGYGEVRVIHGVGTGALRRGLRLHLTGHPLVDGFREGAPYEGGGGATVVTIK